MTCACRFGPRCAGGCRGQAHRPRAQASPFRAAPGDAASPHTVAAIRQVPSHRAGPAAGPEAKTDPATSAAAAPRRPTACARACGRAPSSASSGTSVRRAQPARPRSSPYLRSPRLRPVAAATWCVVRPRRLSGSTARPPHTHRPACRPARRAGTRRAVGRRFPVALPRFRGGVSPRPRPRATGMRRARWSASVSVVARSAREAVLRGNREFLGKPPAWRLVGAYADVRVGCVRWGSAGARL